MLARRRTCSFVVKYPQSGHDCLGDEGMNSFMWLPSCTPPHVICACLLFTLFLRRELCVVSYHERRDVLDNYDSSNLVLPALPAASGTSGRAEGEAAAANGRPLDDLFSLIQRRLRAYRALSATFGCDEG